MGKLELDDFDSSPKGKKQKEVIKGYLEKIKSISDEYIPDFSHDTPMGSIPPCHYNGLVSVLEVVFMDESPKVLQEFRYHGIVLPDSIGHPIEIYRVNESIVKIVDTTLRREYG
jgi:hypothetical protein